MEKKNLIITVSGEVNSGKSCLISVLMNFLRENGFEVDFDRGGDYFDEHVSENLDQVIEHIKDTRKITLKELQTQQDNETTEEDYIRHRWTELFREDQEKLLKQIGQLIINYYTLKSQWDTYADLSIPYDQKNFTICEPADIPMVKNEYEKIFTYYLNLNIKYWDLYPTMEFEDED